QCRFGELGRVGLLDGDCLLTVRSAGLALRTCDGGYVLLADPGERTHVIGGETFLTEHRSVVDRRVREERHPGHSGNATEHPGSGLNVTTFSYWCCTRVAHHMSKPHQIPQRDKGRGAVPIS